MSEIREWFASLKKIGMRRSLEEVSILLARLEMPQMKFPSIHVAGSNGKGTTCVILANALTLSGRSCGLFSSPHLCFVEERVRIDGLPISSEQFDRALAEIRQVTKIKPVTEPSYYEATFLVAMLAFASAGVDRAVIETGLGGRLDATRLCSADCCVLTDIALEHTDVLGETLADIAREKAAIARPGVPFVAKWTYDRQAREVIHEAVADQKDGCWWRPDRDMPVPFSEMGEKNRPINPAALPSNWSPYKAEAAKLAQLALHGIFLSDAANLVESAMAHTVWPGRVHWLEHRGVPVLLDAAHNASGMRKFCDQLLAEMEDDKSPTPGCIILGSTPQADMVGFINPLVKLAFRGEIQKIFITEPQGGRRNAVSGKVLKKEFTDQGITVVEVIESPEKALESAISWCIEDGGTPLLGVGSLYLLGNLLTAMGEDTHEAMTTLLPSEDMAFWT